LLKLADEKKKTRAIATEQHSGMSNTEKNKTSSCTMQKR